MYWIPKGKYNIGDWNVISRLESSEIFLFFVLSEFGRFVLKRWRPIHSSNVKTFVSQIQDGAKPEKMRNSLLVCLEALGGLANYLRKFKCIFNHPRRNGLKIFKWAT